MPSPRELTILFFLVAVAGCGTTKSQQATDQMLMSDAVDLSISQIDFSVLAGQNVYLDTTRLKAIKGQGFVNADYIISSLRQQMFASRLRLTSTEADADVVVEARVGALGTDGHDVTYGVPPSNTISSAASLMPNAPNIPTIPELSLGRRQIQIGGAKIALFAYERESKRPVWQSGVKTAMSDSRSIWVLGAGPFQRGRIHDGTHFAGSRLSIPLIKDGDGDQSASTIAYQDEHVFTPLEKNPIRLSSFISPKGEDAADSEDHDEKEAP